MQTIEFVVAGDEKMHCAGCESRVAYAPRQLPAVREVRARRQTHHVVMLVDSAAGAGAEQIAEKLKQLGYETQRIAGAA